MTKLSRNYISEIKQILAQARQKAYTAVNFAMTEAYWQIGKRIVEEEQQGKERAAYGEEILKTLSKELTKEFGQGFGTRNLWDFRKFYLNFQETEILHTLCAQLSWSHIRLDYSTSTLLRFERESTAFRYQIYALFANRRRTASRNRA